MVRDHLHGILMREHPTGRRLAGSRGLRWMFVSLAVLSLQGIGCQPELMKTPNLYRTPESDPFAQVPPALQTNTVEVVFGTDRRPEQTGEGKLGFSYERSRSLMVGACTVEIGTDLSWDELVRQSLATSRDRALPVRAVRLDEIARYPEVPLPFRKASGSAAAKHPDGDPAGGGPQANLAPVSFEQDPAALAEQANAESSLRQALSERLQTTPRKEVFLLVHGVGTSLEDSSCVMAQIWHYMGRIGVPVVYSWPAGYSKGGVQRYTHDRESGEFTIYHLKQFLRTVASCPDVQKVHVLAHSRGTDIATTALRELHIECRAAGKQTQRELKLANVVLIAADMDFEVISQRLGAEYLFFVPQRFTVYLSESDKAMGAAEWLFGSVRRLGAVKPADLSAQQTKFLGELAQLQLIQVWVHGDAFGHSYFYTSPAVVSDLILLLRDGADPGAENGRPLTKREGGFWELRDPYPLAH